MLAEKVDRCSGTTGTAFGARTEAYDLTGTETAVGDFGTEVLEELVDRSSGTIGAATEVLEEVIALEEGGADLELAAKETPVELTTWLQEGGADFELAAEVDKGEVWEA